MGQEFVGPCLSDWTPAKTGAFPFHPRRTIAPFSIYPKGLAMPQLGTVWKIMDSVSHVFSQAYTLARARAASSASPIIRLMAYRDHAHWEVKLLERELEVLRGQRSKLPPRCRPIYSPTQRIEILQIMRLRGWTASQAAERFVLHPNAIRNWKRAIRNAPNPARLGAPPWNKIHDGVRWLIHELASLCPEPEFGTRSIARQIMRAGIQVSRASVRRILGEEPPAREPDAEKPAEKIDEAFKPCPLLKPTTVNETWHLDLTSIHFLWFQWTVMGLVDGFSRKLLALTLFVRIPKTADITRAVRKAVREEGKPKFLITDHGGQFQKSFARSMKRMDIQVAKGRVGNPRMNGKIERVFKTLKLWQRLILLPLNPRAVQRKLDSYQTWYNRHRTHSACGIQTPWEVMAGLDPPKPIPIRAVGDVEPSFKLRRENFDGDPRMPVIFIAVEFKRKQAA